MKTSKFFVVKTLCQKVFVNQLPSKGGDLILTGCVSYDKLPFRERCARDIKGREALPCWIIIFHPIFLSLYPITSSIKCQTNSDVTVRNYVYDL